MRAQPDDTDLTHETLIRLRATEIGDLVEQRRRPQMRIIIKPGLHIPNELGERIRWVTAIGCPKRPAHQKCVGLISVYRSDVPASVDWFCTACGDDGTISGWERTPYDLQPRPSRDVNHHDNSDDDEVLRVIVPVEIAAVLQTLTFLDEPVERMVFQAAATPHGIVLVGTGDNLDELLDAVAAEANHEPDRRRQKRLDDAIDVLTDALG